MVHLPNASPVEYCGLAINVGTRDELPDEHGMSHFVEHLLFKGTKNRKAWHILNSMESVGGELNAYTTKEETFLYGVFLENYFRKAITLIADMAANPLFPEKEIAKEREVILDEIELYNDSPSELIYDEIEEILFDQYAIGRNILGTRESLQRFHHEEITNFHARNYTAGRMLFFSMGKTDFSKIVRLAEQTLTEIPAGNNLIHRELPQNYIPRHKIERRDTHQVHYITGCRAYSMYDTERIALFLLNNLLGGPGLNSLLNLALRERNGLVYSIESSFTPYTDIGLFSIYFGCEQKNFSKCKRLVYNEIDKLINTPLKDRFIAKAKQQTLGQLTISTENKENLALGMGRSFLHFNRYETIAHIAEELQQITPQHLQNIACKLFDPSLSSTVTYTL